MMATKVCKPKVLLIPDGDLYLAFRLPPIFRRAGWEVDLLCLQDNPLAYSRHVASALKEENWDALFNRLQTILRDPLRPWQAVIVADEATMRRVVATGDAALLQNWQPGALDPEVRPFLLSKFGLATVAQHRQLLVPPSRVCETMADILEFAKTTGWPIIVKPPDESGGRGLMKLHSPAELAANSQSLSLPALAQKYIQGRRGVVDMFCSAGRPLAWLASYSIERRNGEFTPSTARLFLSKPELQSLVGALAQFTRFEGFCGFDWIEEAGTGRHYLIEFHPRAPSGFRFGRDCGVDFSAAAAAWLTGRVDRLPVQVQAPGRSLAARYFSGDLLRCLRQCDWRGLKMWLPGSGARHDIYWDDPQLLAVWVGLRIREWFQGKLADGDKIASREKAFGASGLPVGSETHSR